jgi:DNA-binding Xre family transcriptional regulator
MGLFIMPMSFAPMWETMKKKGYTTYTLKFKLKLGGGTYYRIKNNLPVSTYTLEKLCEFMDCEVQDIIRWERGENHQKE